MTLLQNSEVKHKFGALHAVQRLRAAWYPTPERAFVHATARCN